MMLGRRLNYVLASTVLLAPAIASAHIHLTYPTVRTAQQKEKHCGLATSVRGVPNVLLPGATITVTWDETVNHPGWYRISFQSNGEIFELPPPSDGPAGNGNPSNYPTEDLTGQIDPGTGSLILVDRILDVAGQSTYSQQITLPNEPCDNCTLQIIQMMTDKAPYAIDGGADDNDMYYQCSDLTLSASAPDAAPGLPDAGGGNPAGSDADVGGNGGGATGGCSTGGGSSGVLFALGLGALLVRRRRA
jgi:MYXO-CTERM domain-containing protein